MHQGKWVSSQIVYKTLRFFSKYNSFMATKCDKRLIETSVKSLKYRMINN